MPRPQMMLPKSRCLAFHPNPRRVLPILPASTRSVATETQPGKKFSKDENTKLKSDEAPSASQSQSGPEKKAHHQTSAEADEELRRKLEEMSGDGGASGMEYEDGKPVTGLGKRSVRNNIFRYI